MKAVISLWWCPVSMAQRVFRSPEFNLANLGNDRARIWFGLRNRRSVSFAR